MRGTMNPGLALQTTGTLPIPSSSATSRAVTSGSVPAPGETSTSGSRRSARGRSARGARAPLANVLADQAGVEGPLGESVRAAIETWAVFQHDVYPALLALATMAALAACWYFAGTLASF